MESFDEIKRSLFQGQINGGETTLAGEATVMIVDDNTDIIEALTTLLRPRYCLVSCLSYEEANKRLTPTIKVVLLDIKMASKDGIEAFKLLKDEQIGRASCRERVYVLV